MGRSKSKYNWRARQVVQTTTDDSFSKKIRIDIPENKQSYDESNVFVLPTEKRKTVVKRVQLETKRLLSKKKRKQLEAVLKRKKEKENRSVLLEALSKVQASPEIISQLTSISEVQTKGLKRFLEDEKELASNLEVPKKLKNNSLKGVAKVNDEINVVNKCIASNPNIVGFESSSSSGEDEEESNSKNSSQIEILSEKNSTDEENKILRDDSSSNNIYASNEENDEFIGERELTLQYLEGNKDSNNSACEEDNSLLFNDGVPIKSNICESGQDENCKSNTISNQKKNNNKEKCSTSQIKCNARQRTRNPEEIDISFDEENDPTNKVDSVLSNSDDCVSKTNYVPVVRKLEIQQTRSKLPIIGEEQVIMEAIKENQVVIITGETGSGKTTQVPQFLYEAGYANDGKMIGVTEPRRVAAISMSERVAEELNLSSDEVSYLIRFEGNSGPNTKIKFMTDGVLLKEIQKDFLLSRYSVIILDEVHERSIYTDILLGLLSRIIPLRCKKSMPMRLIIMSATLHIDELRNNEALFKIPPPVISIESRQFPVTIHFNKTTPQNYMLATFKKICKIHSSLPDGGILVFVTGQQEVNLLVKKLRQIFSFSDSRSLNNSLKFKNHINYRYVVDKLKNSDAKDFNEHEIHPSDDTDYDLLDDNDDESKIDVDDIDELEFTNIEQILQLANSGKIGKMWVLPLYSLLPGQEQAKVFKPPPPNYRLCVVATNIAETSLTIPNIKYVVDTGRTKVKLYDKFTGVSTYEIVWASKASANQRAGRAGRTAPGHCYRLYSSAVFNDIFEEWSVPEIKRKPIDELVLQMKCLGIDYIKNFPFPSSPGIDQLKSAECRLVLLGALKPHDSLKDRWFTKLTKLGKSMSEFAVAPRFGKMLCYSHQHNLLAFTVSIVAALAVPQVLDAVKQSQIRKQHSLTGNRLLLGDVYVLHNACSFIEKCIYEKKDSVEKFCDKLGIRYKAVKEVSKLRIQLIKTINVHIQSIQIPITPYVSPPNELQASQLRQIILMGMVDRVARRLDEEESKAADISVNKAVYKLSDIDEVAYVHNSSVLYDTKPTWIVYQDAFEQDGRLYMRGITAIEPEWLPILAPHLCYIPKSYNDQNTFYDPKNQKVVYVATCTFGRAGWSLPAVPIPCPASEETCRYFAKFLLEGKVCTALKKYADKLLSPPETVLKSWSSLLLPRTQTLLKALVSKGVYDGHKLFSLWKIEPKFLLDAYLEWSPNSYHDEIQKIWPPLP